MLNMSIFLIFLENVVEEFIELVMSDQKDLDREVLRRELEEIIPETIEYSY